MDKPRILLQLDPDQHPSSFDAVVAIDAGVDQLLAYGGVQPDAVRSLVHGAIFTRGPQHLRRTAIFVGGTRVAVAEQIFEQVVGTFFGPMRVSVMLDAGGANTTAAAAVLTAAKHLELGSSEVAVLGATGSVGQRVARLLAGQGANLRLVSRSLERAERIADPLRDQGRQVTSHACQTDEEIARVVDGATAVISAGAAGVQLLSEAAWKGAGGLRVAIDLNAVPPLGLEGIEVQDSAVEREGVTCYGAIGTGGTKMAIHKEALRRLFDSNDQALDAEQIFAIGQELPETS